MRQALILLALSAVAAALSQALRPNPLPWRQAWSRYVAEASESLGISVVSAVEAHRIAVSGDHVLLDARPPADYAAGHLPGAFNVPSEDIESHLRQVLPLLTPAQPILTYCSGHQCDESLKLSQHLLHNGFTNVHLFAGGMSDWTAAGYPVEK